MFDLFVALGVTVVGNVVGDLIAYYIIKRFFSGR